jgi:hypothetical protein
MTTKQQNKLAMYLAVKAVLDANNAVWQTLQAFADGYTGFDTQIGLIQTLAQGQNMDTSGIAQDKKASKFAMAQAAVGIASAVRAFAIKTKNNTLAGEVDFNQSDITSARDEDALANCQNIHDLANTNIASLGIFGVTAARLTTLQTAITAFSGLMGKPRQTIATGKTATQQLSDAFDAADLALDEELDNLIGQFTPANAKFVSDYQNARTIVDTAASHASPNQPAPAPTPPTPKP